MAEASLPRMILRVDDYVLETGADASGLEQHARIVLSLEAVGRYHGLRADLLYTIDEFVDLVSGIDHRRDQAEPGAGQEAQERLDVVGRQYTHTITVFHPQLRQTGCQPIDPMTGLRVRQTNVPFERHDALDGRPFFHRLAEYHSQGFVHQRHVPAVAYIRQLFRFVAIESFYLRRNATQCH